MRKTKGDYFGIHGIAKFEQDELDKILCNNFFSINFDESSLQKLKLTELDINVSFVRGDRVVKTHLTTIPLEEGSQAQGPGSC